MKAIILCGGQGTRLRELTEVLPKPLVEVGGRPILWHIMKLYAFHGVTEFILCLGYKGHLIRQYFLNYEAMETDFTINLGHGGSIEYHGRKQLEEINWKVTLVDTGEATMTGARVKRAVEYLGDDERFLLTYGDGLSDVDITESIQFHNWHGKLATVAGVHPPSRFGELNTKGIQVVSFEEKPQIGSGTINGGYFVLERKFLDYLSDEESCILEREPLEKCAHDGQLAVYQHHGFWYAMDTIRDWNVLEEMWGTGAPSWAVWKKAA